MRLIFPLFFILLTGCFLKGDPVPVPPEKIPDKPFQLGMSVYIPAGGNTVTIDWNEIKTLYDLPESWEMPVTTHQVGILATDRRERYLGVYSPKDGKFLHDPVQIEEDFAPYFWFPPDTMRVFKEIFIEVFDAILRDIGLNPGPFIPDDGTRGP